MNLLPPLEGSTYNSLETLISSVNEHAASQGYAITTKRSKKDKKGGIRKVWMQCDQEGKFKRRRIGKRETATRRNECPFALTAQRDLETEEWDFVVTDSHHNHPPTLAGSHPTHRKIAMTEEVKKTIGIQSRINSSAKQTLSAIRLDADEENPFIKARDVWNQRAAFRHQQLGPYSTIQTLMYEFTERDDWFMRHEVDSHARITRLFFSRSSSQKILKWNHEVLLMDCTYKTNAYGMPLCIINGVTALNTTFYVAFCFLSGEKTADYDWLLAALKELYITLDLPNPNVLITDA